jgi:thiaminase
MNRETVLATAKEIISKLRSELEDRNKEILSHPYVEEALRGVLPLKKIKSFVVNQLYIVFHDMKSLAHLVSRAQTVDEVEFFSKLYLGDKEAFKALLALAEEVGVHALSLDDVNPEAVAYTHYLSWLALHASLGEAAVALIINLPVWGSNTKKLSVALREKYGIKRTDFLDMFAGPYDELEKMSYPIIERYLNWERYRTVARFIQYYEKLFWDAIYKD